MRHMPEAITIRIGRRLAMTVEQLAAELGKQPSSVRGTLSRRRIAPDGYVNARTPVWLAAPTLAKLRRDKQPADDQAG
jgi:Mn-dependent DtxR family transcriptional regulator